LVVLKSHHWDDYGTHHWRINSWRNPCHDCKLKGALTIPLVLLRVAHLAHRVGPLDSSQEEVSTNKPADAGFFMSDAAVGHSSLVI
jgi:hypothetical protein